MGRASHGLRSGCPISTGYVTTPFNSAPPLPPGLASSKRWKGDSRSAPTNILTASPSPPNSQGGGGPFQTALSPVRGPSETHGGEKELKLTVLLCRSRVGNRAWRPRRRRRLSRTRTRLPRSPVRISSPSLDPSQSTLALGQPASLGMRYRYLPCFRASRASFSEITLCLLLSICLRLKAS